MNEAKLKPQIMIVAIDCTDDYSENVKELCGRIADIYFYNKNEITYCCEIIPSYWLEYVVSYAQNSPDDDIEREKMDDLLAEANLDTTGKYCHCHTVEKAKPFLLKQFDDKDILRMGDQDLNDYVKEYVAPDEFYSPRFLPWEK